MNNDVEHLFMWLLAIHISLVKCVFKYFAHFLIGLFYYWTVRVLCIVSIQISYQIHDMQIISPFLWLVFYQWCLLKCSFLFWWSLIYFLILWIMLLVPYLKILAYPKLTKTFSPMFSSQSFIVLALTFKSDLFWVNLFMVWSKDLSLLFFLYGYPTVLNHLLKRLSFF